MDEQIKTNMRIHNQNLSIYATKDEDAVRFLEEKEDIRGPFFRDIDRIIYSYAFIRYSDKTQVFPGHKNNQTPSVAPFLLLISSISFL